jgi:NADPH-dependent 2,4-dienoyl-CoA reductase/sulfur reductase-like enzyme
VTADVIVVGGGPAGLACAIELRNRGVADVLVLDREARAGGIPRHCGHQGFGLRDLRRLMPGPRYARRYVDLARKAGARVLEETTVTGWSDGALDVTSPAGREQLRAAAVVLATGCRERPRAARLVPGSRPEGVMTTGTLQQLVDRRRPVGTRALVVGAEHVSFSALLTLAHAGAEVVAMATELPRHQSLEAIRLGARLRYRTPVWTRTAVTAIHGRPRVEEVELLDLDSGRTRRVACDTVVFTGDWIPDHELAMLAGLELDPGTRGPRVDAGLHTARRGLFAAGNLLHGAEPADIASLSGRHAAASVAGWLADRDSWPQPQLPIECRDPLHWISPNAVSRTEELPPRLRFALRSKAFLRAPAIEIRQDGRLLWKGRLPRLVPGRSASLPWRWIGMVDPTGGPIEVGAIDGVFAAGLRSRG